MAEPTSGQPIKTTAITEGQVVKGGQNPVNVSTTRPPAPQGSNGATIQNQGGSSCPPVKES